MSKHKVRMGRPPIPEAERRSVRIALRVTVEEYEAMERAAGTESVSEWLRRVALRAARRRAER